MSTPGHVAPQPARILGGVDAACIVVGAIIGVGIFFTPSRMAAMTGSGALLLLAWVIGGIIALCGALAFAELGRLHHASGAQYEVLRDAYGPCPAFLFVFCNATAIQAGAVGIIAVVCQRNLAVALGVANVPPIVQTSLAVLLVAALTLTNVAGAQWGARVQNLTVYAKVLTLVAIAVLAAVSGRHEVLAAVAPPADPAAAHASQNPVAGLLAALVPAFFAFGGWQHALWISGEVRDPRRTLPRAILAGVLLVVAVYLLANWAYLRLLGAGGVAASGALAADAVGAAWGEPGRRVVAGAVGLSALGVLNAQLLSGPRLIFAMARDGRFFPLFGRLSPSRGAPVPAIILLGSMGVLLLLIAGFDGVDKLLTGAVFIDGVFFAATAAALLLLRRRRSPEERAQALPFSALGAAVFFIGELAVVAGSYVDPAARSAALLGAAWIGAAWVLYMVRFRRPAGAAPAA